MSIYDKTKMMCRTWIEVINNLFSMGKELEESVDGMKGGIVKDVTLTEVDKHYTLTILYDDNTSDTVTWDDSTVGIEDITLTYNDGVYILTIELTDGTRYTFSIPVGNVVTEEELTALNLGTPDDEASSIGSLWARIKDAVSRITTLETADTNNVKKTGTSVVTGDIQVPTTPANPTSVINSAYANDVTEGVNNLLHKTGNETKTGELKVTNHLTANEDLVVNSSYSAPIKLVKNNISRDDNIIGNYAICYYDMNNVELARLQCRLRSDKSTALVVQVLNADGTWKTTTLSEGNP